MYANMRYLETYLATIQFNLIDVEGTIPSGLSDLADVDVSSAVDGDVLTYDSGLWVPDAPAGGTFEWTLFTPVWDNTNNTFLANGGWYIVFGDVALIFAQVLTSGSTTVSGVPRMVPPVGGGEGLATGPYGYGRVSQTGTADYSVSVFGYQPGPPGDSRLEMRFLDSSGAAVEFDVVNDSAPINPLGASGRQWQFFAWIPLQW